MESNFTNCKVSIVGNRTDKHKQWSLDNDKIGEDDNDKYLGVYFSRNSQSNYHITKHLEKKHGQQNKEYDKKCR